MIDPITQAVRDALPAPLLSQAQCHRVAVAVLRAVREPSRGQELAMSRALLANYPRVVHGEVCTSVALLGAIYGASLDTRISELEKEPAE